jgi:hypothetical protein
MKEYFMTPYDYQHCGKSDAETVLVEEQTDSEGEQYAGSSLVKCLMKLNFINIVWNEDGSVNLSEMVVINHNSAKYLFFNFFVTFCCLISSYIYVFMAAHRKSVEEEFSLTVILMLFFEGVFFTDVCVNFLLSYEYMGEYGKVVERNITNIFSHYLKTTFIKDFIPIIPFQLIQLPKSRGTLFYLIKLLRLAKGFRLLDVFTIMKQIKDIYKNYSIRMIA